MARLYCVSTQPFLCSPLGGALIENVQNGEPQSNAPCPSYSPYCKRNRCDRRNCCPWRNPALHPRTFSSPLVSKYLVQLSWQIRAVNTCKDTWGEDAEEFRPERWLNLPKDYHPTFSLLSFIAGPHTCIGKTMAILEMKAILAYVSLTPGLILPWD